MVQADPTETRRHAVVVQDSSLTHFNHSFLLLSNHLSSSSSTLINLHRFELNFFIKYKDFISPLLTLRPKNSKNIHNRGKGKRKIERYCNTAVQLYKVFTELIAYYH